MVTKIEQPKTSKTSISSSIYKQGSIGYNRDLAAASAFRAGKFASAKKKKSKDSVRPAPSFEKVQRSVNKTMGY